MQKFDVNRTSLGTLRSTTANLDDGVTERRKLAERRAVP